MPGGSKPRGLGPEYADQFRDASVVAAYDARPPYPDALISFIVDVAGGGRGSRVLDLGCGTGELTRRLAPHVEWIAAVDRSAPMIARGRSLPGGRAANIEWIEGDVENAPASGSFSLALAAESFHWFDWPRVCARLRQLVPSSHMVLVEGREERGSPWAAPLASLIAASSTNREFEAYDLVRELTSGGHVVAERGHAIGPYRFVQPVDDYLRCLHSRNGLSLDRMAPEAAARFDADVRELLSPHADAGTITLDVEVAVTVARVVDPART